MPTIRPPIASRRTMRATLHVYRDRAGEWRWRMRTANGRIVADSGEGYTRRLDATRAATRVVELAALGVALTVGE